MATKADVERWRAWELEKHDIFHRASGFAIQYEQLRDGDGRVVKMADMLTTAAELLARWDEAEGDLEADGNALCWGATCEWLAEWRGGAPDA